MTLLLPTAYFPPITYFVCLLKADEVLIEKHEYYIKQTYRNRTHIYSPNGLLALSVPVIKVNGNKTMIKDISISYHSNWQTIHWRSIETAYNSSPYFLYYKDEIYPFFNQHTPILFDYNFLILQKLLELIGINKQIKFTETYLTTKDLILDTRYPIPDTCFIDLRNLISSHHHIITLSHQFSPYPQVFSHKHGFLPNLSILDLLFNLGPRHLIIFLTLLTPKVLKTFQVSAES